MHYSIADAFEVETLKEEATAEELKPGADTRSINELVRQAPLSIDF